MVKEKELAKARVLLSQALKNIPDGQAFNEAKMSVRRAIENVDKQVKRLGKKAEQTYQDSWWTNIESGVSNVAASPMTQHAQMRALDALNKMIDETRLEIDKLEEEKRTKKEPVKELEDLFLQG